MVYTNKKKFRDNRSFTKIHKRNHYCGALAGERDLFISYAKSYYYGYRVGLRHLIRSFTNYGWYATMTKE
jgi:hypothetical protein